jgi:hypothetical protein
MKKAMDLTDCRSVGTLLRYLQPGVFTRTRTANLLSDNAHPAVAVCSNFPPSRTQSRYAAAFDTRYRFVIPVGQTPTTGSDFCSCGPISQCPSSTCSQRT